MQQGKLAVIVMVSLITACHVKAKSPPTQVVYRFDNHRYLELVGYNCEGALWYTDSTLNIRTEITSQFYKIFTKKYLHPSQRYISITGYEGGGFLISKDYGRTWDRARYSPGSGAMKYGDDHPQREEIESFTVVNDQGFMLTKKGDLYLSSKPFDDPRLEPGGSGIDYTYTYRGDTSKHHLEPINSSVGSLWGKNYVSWISIQLQDPWQTFAYQTNFQNIPNKVPEVKNYTGWDHMRCNPDLGLEVSEQQK